MAPRFSASGSFAGVYGISEIVGSVIDETANYTGAVMIFQQTEAPTGWTKSTDHHNAILTSTTGSVTVGGTTGFTTTFGSSVTLNGSVTLASLTVGGTTLTSQMLPPHTHTYVGYSAQNLRSTGPGSSYNVGTNLANNPGGGGSHTHPAPPVTSNPANYFTKDLRIKYVDVIIATKD